MSQSELTIDSEHHGMRLDVFLAKALEEAPSRTFVKRLIDEGFVLVDDKQVKAHQKVLEGQKVSVDIPEDFIKPMDVAPENIPLDIFYEDERLAVVNKPVGMIVHPTTSVFHGTLVNALLYHCQQLSDVNAKFRPGIVHRLDQETSGLILIAKDNKAHEKLARQFAEHTVKKRYVALVEGDVEFEEGLIDAPLGRHPIHREKRDVNYSDEGKDSVTFYKVIKRVPKVTMVALFPQTGRTHQLRVHMAHIGHPILGDQKYGRKLSFPRLALHAQSIGFTHPSTGHYVEFSSTPPKEFLDRMSS